jgi:hypothetical protein
VTPQEMVANAMLDRNPQANRLGIPQQMGAFANSLGMVPTPEQEALQEPLISPETYGIGTMLKKAAPMLPGALGMTVFHGSPHSFDKFDMSKIGTGEGAQAFGHGLYFAENPAVAKGYADALGATKGAWGVDDSPIFATVAPEVKAKLPESVKSAIDAAYRANGAEYAKNRVVEMIDKSTQQVGGKRWLGMPKELAPEHRDSLIDLMRSGKWTEKAPGHTYKVDLPDESMAKMLDWDKPLSQQPETVRNAMAESFGITEDIPGHEIYNKLMNKLMGNKGTFQGVDVELSQKLKAAGIPGIRYLDQGSRTGRNSTSNYVVFDDTLPKIVGKE